MNKPSKYRNVKTVVDGITFDSKKEANYYGVLKMRKLAGEIDNFARQVAFDLSVNGIHICSYFADFVTSKGDNITYEVIDIKGVKTPVYQLKKKLMKACMGITIIEK